MINEFHLQRRPKITGLKFHQRHLKIRKSNEFKGEIKLVILMLPKQKNNKILYIVLRKF